MRKSSLYFIVLILLALGLVLFAARSPRLEVRQPRSDTAVHPVTKQFLLKKNTALAKATAERLDGQAVRLIEASSATSLQRWWRGVDLRTLESRYRSDVTLHLQAMAEVMKLRRENGGRLAKLHEFDFQNLLRKSDYIVSSRLTQTKLNSISPYILQAYKSERKFTSLRPLLAAN